ncbi:MAG: AsnC family transcriptional regulator [Desulfurella sp.]|uniref:DNA-binding transcriptional regulator, Lrp family n=1 Tax=Thermodesulfobium acidiphilum TaxID=1794699 RepID=A0A2R4W015_THEAF|nr:MULTISPECIES: Lrp/AsnC family transcriptional regulator [Bacteria]AWB10151.1 DNA-binding transcriptional regulator, Lrp family [Thermodesulfobium acidiphilum]PMP92754.1 MAG: AsnC family transcriptional regulator [Desulfurella sp.]
MHFKSLDEVDRQILKHLLENGRLSNAELGRKLNLTRAAVRDRVNKLIENGIIDRFTIIINPLKAGRNISMYFEIEVEWPKINKVVEELLKKEEITNIYQMSSFPHLHVHALFEDQTHTSNFIESLKTIDGVKSLRSEIIIKRFKERGSILI